MTTFAEITLEGNAGVHDIVRPLLLQMVWTRFASPPHVNLREPRVVFDNLQGGLQHRFVVVLVPLSKRESLEVREEGQER